MRENIIQGDAVSFFEKVSKLFTAGRGSTASETADCDLKGIKIGDWVESVYLKGYFKVYQIKHCYREGKNEGYLLLLKKAFMSSMKFSFTTEKCHVAWCEKLTENKVRELENLLEENPSKKKKFEEMPPLFPCLQIFYFLDISKDRIDEFREKLKELPRYFTKEHFESFLSQADWQPYIKSSSEDPKNEVMLAVYTQEWIVDSHNQMLYCNPQIGNLYGTLAKLDTEEWNDF